MNQMTLLGRVGQDSVVRFTANGTAVAEVSVADNKKKKDGTVTVNWFRVVLWGWQAEKYAPLCKKGTEVFAQGEYERREYLDRDGNKKIAEELHAYKFGVFVKVSGDGVPDAGSNEPQL